MSNTHRQSGELTTRDGWIIALTWFAAGLLIGAWAASGFPIGVLL